MRSLASRSCAPTSPNRRRGRSRAQSLRQLLRAAEPSRHPEVLEPSPGAFEERQGTLAVAGRAAPLVHERLVEVGDGAQRARPLLLEDGAGAGEPVGGFVVPSLEPAEPRE